MTNFDVLIVVAARNVDGVEIAVVEADQPSAQGVLVGRQLIEDEPPLVVGQHRDALLLVLLDGRNDRPAQPLAGAVDDRAPHAAGVRRCVPLPLAT